MHAVIDIGSNSVLLLIASRRADASLDIARDEARVARLSEGVAKTGRLSDAAIERTLEILREYAELARAAEAPIRALATEGLRMAADPERFLAPAREILGVEVEIIAGEEEARASYLSVAREQPSARELRVIDIGGASTELVVGEGETIRSMVSHRIGSVRLTEALVADPRGPVGPAELEAIEAEARRAFEAQTMAPAPELHGLAGTVTTLAAIALGLSSYARERVDGTRIARAEVRALRDALAAQTLAQRVAAHPTLSPKRADVIVAGASILCCALEHCGAETLVVRDRGLRYAYLPRGD